MTYLLDTNVCVGWLRGNAAVRRRLLDVGFEACAIAEVTLFELHYGIANSIPATQADKRAKLVVLVEQLEVLPVISCLDFYAAEKTRLRRAGLLIEDFDLLIGCTALTYQLPLVTANRKHFECIPGLLLETWPVD